MPRLSGLLDSGTMMIDAMRASTPMGTLSQKMLCHPQASTMTPPRAGPSARAMPDTPAQMPMAWARCLGSRKVSVRIGEGVRHHDGRADSLDRPCRR